jgi:nitrogen fixation protein NifZ
MMIESREPQYDWGQRVVALVDIVNDGSHPERAADAVMVEVGSEGEIVQIGRHEELNHPVYMVDFDGLVIGCLEEEILLLQELNNLSRAARASQDSTVVSGAT